MSYNASYVNNFSELFRYRFLEIIDREAELRIVVCFRLCSSDLWFMRDVVVLIGVAPAEYIEVLYVNAFEIKTINVHANTNAKRIMHF